MLSKNETNFRFKQNRYNKPYNSNQSYNNSNQERNISENCPLNIPFIKQQLIKYIYNTLDISKFKYKLLEFEYDLTLLKENSYHVSPNYNGINCLLVFIKIKEKYYSFLIDRKTLSYKINQIDYEKIKIIPIEVRLDQSIYNGTIIDGVLMYNNSRNQNDNIKNFVINDIYYFRGQDLTGDKIQNKMLHINAYLDNYLKQDTKMNNINFIINKIYEMSDLKKLVDIYIPESKYNQSIKGIAFFPEVSGIKLIYLYNNCTSTKVDNSSPTNPAMASIKIDNSSNKIIRPNNIDTNEEITAIFKMIKTDTIDVYNLYLSEIIEQDGKKFVRYKKYGIAYVPTKECSFFCKDLYEKMKTDAILINCKYIRDKDKWIPINLVENKKIPDNILNVDAKIN